MADVTALFKRVDTIFLPVVDIQNTYDWYVDTLGFSKGWQAPNGDYRTLVIGETSLTLYQAEESSIVRAEHAAFNFFAPDAAEARRLLIERGVRVGEIESDPDGTISWFRFYDPEGNGLEVCSFPE